MEKETEKMRELFEQFFFGPLNTVLSSFINEKARRHLDQARTEVLKAIRVYIDGEIEKLDRETKPEE